MKRGLILVSLLLAGALTIVFITLILSNRAETNTETPSAVPHTSDSPDEVLVRLSTDLGEPRHYCLDIPGYPSSLELKGNREAAWALEAHTCKLSLPPKSADDTAGDRLEAQDKALLDMYISQKALAEGRIQFARLDACMEATYATDDGMREDAPIVVNECSDAQTQQIMLRDDGTIRPAVDDAKCLTIGTEALEAGDRAPGEHWYRRPLTFSTCIPDSPSQAWEVSPSPTSTPDFDLADARTAPTSDRQIWQAVDMPEAAGEPGEILIRLVDELDEPRHYCVDIPGYPHSLDITQHREALWALEAHTCKIDIPNEREALLDMAILESALEQGRIEFNRLNACMEVSFHREGVVREDSPLVVNSCSEEPKQEMIFGADGRIRPAVDPSKCLTVHAASFEAGDRAPGEPWHRRPLTFSTCAA